MHCLIIDDNPKAGEQLNDFLKRHPLVTSVHTGFQPYMVSSILASENIDIVFSRVRLWNYRVFSKLEIMPVIVFLCGGKDKLTYRTPTSVPYKLPAPFNFHSVDVLLRRLKTERVIERPGYFFVRFEGSFHRLFFDEILMIERMKMNYVRFYTRHSSMLISGTIAHWLSLLPEGKFVRISDTLVLPISEAKKIKLDEEYSFMGRSIKLTFRFATQAKKELEQTHELSHWTRLE